MRNLFNQFVEVLLVGLSEVYNILVLFQIVILLQFMKIIIKSKAIIIGGLLKGLFYLIAS